MKHVCGITGIWNRDNFSPVSYSELTHFNRILAHRGPDGEGYYDDSSVGLGFGHRRLAILDRSEAGTQPMAYANGRYWITFNGEIYNFIELRRELEQFGYAFRTDSDTEVVLAAFDRWGADCQTRFNGMWAFAIWDTHFAIWDTHEKRLFLSRDRFGVKPLLYYVSPSGRFAFASELKAFAGLDDFPLDANWNAMNTVLRHSFQLESTVETLYKDVSRLLPGHCMWVTPQAITISRWWNTLDHLVETPKTFDDQVAHFTALFTDACRIRLRSDVPVSTTLSGGMDSSSVAGCLFKLLNNLNSSDYGHERIASEAQRVFIASFPGTPIDETEYAMDVARFIQADPIVDAITGDQVEHQLMEMLYDFEEIYGGFGYPAWALYRTLRQHNSVVSIDGHGGDELLGGYPHYTDYALSLPKQGLFGAMVKTADLVKTRIGLYSPKSQTPIPNAWQMGIENFFTTATAMQRFKPFYQQHISPRLSPPTVSSAGITPPFNLADWLKDDTLLPSGIQAVQEAASAGLQPISALLYRDFHAGILPNILRNFDRASMAHGVEIRAPFMDWRLVTYCFSLPDDTKIKNGYTKAILREGTRGLIPESIRLRTDKIGFNSPLPEWYATRLRPWLHDVIDHSDFQDHPLWDGKAVRQAVHRQEASGTPWQWNDALTMWLLLNSFTWQSIFTDRSKLAPFQNRGQTASQGKNTADIPVHV